MGKKSRKLRSPKYRMKAAALRKTVAMIKGQLEEATEEAAEITATAEIVEEINTQPAGESASPKISHPKEQPKAVKTAPTKKKTTSTVRKNRATKTKVDA